MFGKNLSILMNIMFGVKGDSVTPYVNIQPQMFLPTILHTLQSPDGIEPVENLEGEIWGNRMLSIQFSVKYQDSIPIKQARVKRFFNTAQTQLLIKKFCKKQSTDEAYDETKHKVICFGPFYSGDSISRNIKLFISKSPKNINQNQLKKGCQLVSISCDEPDGINYTSPMVKEAIQKLKQCLKIEHDQSYAFQFSVLTERAKAVYGTKKIDPINTDMFKFVFDESGYSVALQEVSPAEYHTN